LSKAPPPDLESLRRPLRLPPTPGYALRVSADLLIQGGVTVALEVGMTAGEAGPLGKPDRLSGTSLLDVRRDIWLLGHAIEAEDPWHTWSACRELRAGGMKPRLVVQVLIQIENSWPGSLRPQAVAAPILGPLAVWLCQWLAITEVAFDALKPWPTDEFVRRWQYQLRVLQETAQGG
jgi:hypothetical protein